ncbi:hypothetical protein ADK67_35720 [Saccharothrix sp. NRRL B-16348]|nr:hypothetical protein ADK67_35720 [Saccharothrix sp. NRRL B-16348]
MVGAWLLLTGFSSLWLGVAWDGQWHVDVGPDTFFTAPHLMFYFGSALIGLTSLAVVLPSRGAAAGPGVRVLGFRAPAPFLVAGLGAAGHLLYGAIDLWWHTIYGFDILESTPSHLSLQLAMQVQAIAVIMAFAALRHTTSGRWGLAAAGAFSVAASSIMLDGDVFGVSLTVLGGGAVTAWTLCAIAGVTRSAWWVAALGLLFVAVHAATFFFPPLATGLYSEGIGQPLRDNALGVPLIALAMPLVFPLIAVVGAVAVAFARRRDVSPPLVMAALGAVIGLLVVLSQYLFDEVGTSPLLAALVITAFGAIAGRFGWQSAALMRRLTPREA